MEWFRDKFIPGFIAAVVLFVLVLVWNGITGGQVLGWLGGVSSDQLTEAIAEIEKVGSGDLAYLASKNALGKAVRARAMKWGECGVRINAVAPGPVLTPLLQGSLDTPGTGDAVRALKVPLGRYGEPREIAGLIAFLLGDQAAFIQGSVYYIDGGIDAAMRPNGY